MNGPQIKVCPLYAGLPAAKQLQVWAPAPPGVRKIVLATNIAEASVTIPGIKYIIDTGMVKERYRNNFVFFYEDKKYIQSVRK